MSRPRPPWPLAAALAAVAIALVVTQQALQRGREREARQAEARRQAARAELQARQAARPRSAAELRDAMLRGPSLETGRSAPEPVAATAGPIDWRTLTDSCVYNLRRSGPRVTLRVTESTGFVPTSDKAADRLGFPWDQAIRLDLEPAEGGGARTRVECYFQKGRLQGIRQV